MNLKAITDSESVLYMELANENLADFKILYDHGSYNTAAYCLYYAMFHANNAALVNMGEEALKNHQTANFKIQEIVTKYELTPIFSTVYSQLRNLRTTASYNPARRVSGSDLTKIVKVAFEFVEKIKVIIQN
jgi:uncharacterized protein (UPF0332 family)